MFDIVVLVLAICAFVRGFMRGLISELAGIAALAIGVYGAARLSPYVEVMLSPYVSSGPIRIVAFAITLSLIVVAVHFVSSVANRLARAMALSLPNKLCGGLFGATKVLFLLSCLLGIVNRLWPSEEGIFTREQKEQMITYNFVEGFSSFVFPYIDKGLDAVKEYSSSQNAVERPTTTE